jgi:hypothetical protein
VLRSPPFAERALRQNYSSAGRSRRMVFEGIGSIYTPFRVVRMQRLRAGRSRFSSTACSGMAIPRNSSRAEAANIGIERLPVIENAITASLSNCAIWDGWCCASGSLTSKTTPTPAWTVYGPPWPLKAAQHALVCKIPRPAACHPVVGPSPGWAHPKRAIPTVSCFSRPMA